MTNNDASIQCFLNYEKSQGKEHPRIQELFDHARKYKAEARYHLNLANIEPRINPKENEIKATECFTIAKGLYQSIHFKIQEQLCVQ